MAASSSDYEITVPKIAGLTSACVVDLLVKEGDYVKEGDPLLLIEADKVSVEIPSPSEGIVKQIAVKRGDNVSIGQTIFLLSAKEQVCEEAAFSGEKPSSGVVGSEKGHSVGEPNVVRSSTSLGSSNASPFARRLARDLGVDLGTVRGTGKNGLITKEDVDRAYASSSSVDSSAFESGGVLMTTLPSVEEDSSSFTDFGEFGPVETVPLTKVQRASGAHLHKSWLAIPSVTHIDEADITDLDVFRRNLDDVGKCADDPYRVSLLPFILKASVFALKAYPLLASSITPCMKSVIYKKYYNIGVAVDTPAGLLVPVIKDVDKKLSLIHI